MATHEEQVREAEEALKRSEDKRKRFLLGIPDITQFSEVLETDASNLLEIVERLKKYRTDTDRNYLEKIDVLESIQRSIEASEGAIQVINGFAPEINQLLTKTNLAIYELITRLDDEMAKNAVLRDHELETLENINEYIRKYA